MKRSTSYRVSWTSGGCAEESRRFDEWEPAAEFYAGIVADRRIDGANLVEVSEAEVRCFKREAACLQPSQATAVPAGRGRTWLSDTDDSP